MAHESDLLYQKHEKMCKEIQKAFRTLLNITRHLAFQIPVDVESSGYIAIDKGEIEEYGRDLNIDLSNENIRRIVENQSTVD